MDEPGVDETKSGSQSAADEEAEDPISPTNRHQELRGQILDDRRGDGEPPFFAVDNVEALSAAGQIALFNTFNRLRARGGKLLTTAGAPPSQLGLREDLRTRLGSGQIVQMHPLTDEQMIEAIRAHAAERKLPLPIEAINYLLARAPRDMRSVMALLVALDRYSLEHKRAITLPLLREILHAPTVPTI